MLIQDIVRRVREATGDSAVLQFSNETLTDWINDGIRECVIENSLLQARATANTVAGQKEYALPTDIFKIQSVWFDGRKIEVMTLEEWEALAGDTTVTNSNVNSCYVFAGLLSLYPTPSVVKPLTINYTKMPTTVLFNNTSIAWAPNTPPIPEPFHSRIVTYCLAQVAFQDDDYAKYQALMQEFKTGVMDLKHLKDQQEDLYSFISVSPRDSGDWYE